MTKANSNMGDSHDSYKRNMKESKRSVTTSPGKSTSGPRMINKKEPTNSGSVY